MALNVMLVEDQALIRMGIELAITKISQSEIVICSVAENGDDAVRKFTLAKPDVILMDMHMPGMDGLEACKQIRVIDKHAKIIFLTNNDAVEDVFSAFSSGASGYCLKDVKPDTLVDFIRKAYEGAISVDPRIAADMLRFLTTREAMPDLKATAQMNGTCLNARDAEVLGQMINGSAGEIMTVNTKLSIINILNKIASLSDTGRTKAYSELGDTVAVSDKYELIELLGRGGMGTVYKAMNKSSGDLVAIKVLTPGSASAWQRFVQEASMLTKLSHQSVVKVFDFLVDHDGTAYMIMELVDGPSLMNVVDCGGAIIEKEAVPIFLRCAEALEHLHRAGVVHRDLKPSNIILFCEDEKTIIPKVVDFGVSKFSNLLSADRLTLQGEVLGSPLYMSPEQCRGEDVTFQSDIYSFGCVMFEVLTGFPPFVGANYFETMNLHSHAPVPNLRASKIGRHALSSAIIEIVEKCLAKSPHDRYESAELLVQTLSFVKTIHR